MKNNTINEMSKYEKDALRRVIMREKQHRAGPIRKKMNVHTSDNTSSELKDIIHSIGYSG